MFAAREDLVLSRIEDLAERARKLAPAIVVLDGLDEAPAAALSLMQQKLWASSHNILWIGTARAEIVGFTSLLRTSTEG